MSCKVRCITTIAAITLASQFANTQYHDKREAKLAESAQVQNVKGGTMFQVSIPYEKAFEGALNHLKRQGYAIDSASADSGQIVTAMEIKGSYRQTGKRVVVICIKDSNAQTSIRAVVTEQKRTKLLQTEPWGDAKANEGESAKMADQIKIALGT